jgi:hypothetical protein
MQRRAAATAELTVTLHHALQLRPSRGQTQIIGDLPLNKSLLLCTFFIAHQVWDQGGCELPPGKQALCSHLILIVKQRQHKQDTLGGQTLQSAATRASLGREFCANYTMHDSGRP